MVTRSDDSANVVMKIIEANGETKEGSLSIQRKKTKSSHFTLIRLIKPRDLKGTALLRQIENGNEQQWIYLPARIEYYSAKNQILKRVEFNQYQNFNAIQRAQSIKIKNLVNKRGTDLTLSNIKSNIGLSDDIFSQRALTKE